MEVKGSSESIWWIVVECACRILGVSTATGKKQPLGKNKQKTHKQNIKVQLSITHMYDVTERRLDLFDGCNSWYKQSSASLLWMGSAALTLLRNYKRFPNAIQCKGAHSGGSYTFDLLRNVFKVVMWLPLLEKFLLRIFSSGTFKKGLHKPKMLESCSRFSHLCIFSNLWEHQTICLLKYCTCKNAIVDQTWLLMFYTLCSLVETGADCTQPCYIH